MNNNKKHKEERDPPINPPCETANGSNYDRVNRHPSQRVSIVSVYPLFVSKPPNINVVQFIFGRTRTRFTHLIIAVGKHLTSNCVSFVLNFRNISMTETTNSEPRRNLYFRRSYSSSPSAGIQYFLRVLVAIANSLSSQLTLLNTHTFVVHFCHIKSIHCLRGSFPRRFQHRFVSIVSARYMPKQLRSLSPVTKLLFFPFLNRVPD